MEWVLNDFDGERPAAHPQGEHGRYDYNYHYDYGVDGIVGCWT
jgi:hypothetical protein